MSKRGKKIKICSSKKKKTPKEQRLDALSLNDKIYKDSNQPNNSSYVSRSYLFIEEDDDVRKNDPTNDPSDIIWDD